MNNRLITFILAAIIFVFAIACNQNPASTESDAKKELNGDISISGAFALYPMVVKWAEEFQKINPKVRINVSAGGAGKGMTDVLQNMVELAMVSRGIKDEEIKQGAWFVAVTKDAVLPTINAANPVLIEIEKKGISKNILSSLFLDKKKQTWGKLYSAKSQATVNVYTRSDACGAAEMWAKYFDKKQEDLLGIGVFGDPGIADAVKNDVNAIGFNNVIYAYDLKTRKPYPGIAILPLDLNENGTIDASENFYGSLDSVMAAIRTGKYPSPPARDLYLVSKGKPTNPIVNAFIEWILTEGQKFVDEGGYVKFTDDKLKIELQKIK
jgi:phosphate transport system substrate-binding protein